MCRSIIPVAVLVIFFVSVVGLCLAQEEAPKITLDVGNSTVQAVAAMISEAVGVKVRVAPGVADRAVPRFKVENLAVEQALQTLCLMTGLELKLADKAYHIVEVGGEPVEAGQEATPDAQALATEPLVLDDMEGELGARWTDNWVKNPVDLVPDNEVVKQGETSGKWEPDVAAKYIFTTRMPHDWTGYDSIAMWVHSERATDAVMAILLDSDDPDTEGKDYYRYLLKIDWEGWYEIRLYEHSFQRAREPVGFSKIDVLRFAFEGWPGMVEYVPGTVLRFDDIRLMPPEPPGDELFIFRADSDCGNWGTPGGALSCVREPSRTGGRVSEWFTLAQTSIWNAAVPRDWSGYSYLNMWLYCKEAIDAQVMLWVESVNPATDKQDCYRTRIPLDWQGWKLHSFALEDLEIVREPLGWDQIDILKFYSAGYVETGPGTTLYLDDMWLSKDPPEQVEGQD